MNYSLKKLSTGPVNFFWPSQSDSSPRTDLRGLFTFLLPFSTSFFAVSRVDLRSVFGLLSSFAAAVLGRRMGLAVTFVVVSFSSCGFVSGGVDVCDFSDSVVFVRAACRAAIGSCWR